MNSKTVINENIVQLGTLSDKFKTPNEQKKVSITINNDNKEKQMETNSMPHSTAIGTLGGTLLSIITVNCTTIIATVIVAAIGAVTSFFVSLALKKIYDYFTTKGKK